MDRFQAIQAFKEVARSGGFAAAARSLNISPPSVTRLISDLEADIGVRLFNRSTRNVSLTEEGEQLLLRGVSLIDEFDVVTEEIRESRSEPKGHLKISSVAAFGQERVAHIVTGFLEKYPRVTVDLHISNRKVDLIQEHFDLVFRVGGAEGLEVSALKARRIYAQKLIFVASPGYTDRYGMPESPAHLENHCLVKQVSGSWGRVNEFRRNGRTVTCNLPQNFVVNSPNAAMNAILTGRVMGLLADYLAAEHLKSGRLIRVLPEYETEDQPIYAMFVHRNFMPAKVRVFIDYIVSELGRRPEV